MTQSGYGEIYAENIDAWTDLKEGNSEAEQSEECNCESRILAGPDKSQGL